MPRTEMSASSGRVAAVEPARWSDTDQGYEIAGGTPGMSRARYEEDAKRLVREQAARRRRSRSRREFLLIPALVAVLLVGWGLFELLVV